MRLVLICVLGFAAALVARANDVELTRVQHGWREAESFERIAEFFTGREKTGGQTILRTHPESREGYYFLARLKNSGGTLTDAKFLLHVIAPNDPQPKTFTFPATLATGASVFSLGLTGSDWTNSKNSPVAWKLELLRGDGQVMATEKSFLWEKPAK